MKGNKMNGDGIERQFNEREKSKLIHSPVEYRAEKIRKTKRKRERERKNYKK